MDPFETLGVPRRYQIDMQQLESRYRDLQRALHPDRFAGASPSERRMSLAKAVEVNEAYRALKDDLARGEALLKLQGGKPATTEAPEFLMEMMELREELGEARLTKDLARVRKLAALVDKRAHAAREALADAFEPGAQPPSLELLQDAARVLGRLKYFRRMLDEVSAIEEEAQG